MANQKGFSGLVIGLISVLLGGGAAVAAVAAVVASSAPNDGLAVQTGPQSIVAPTEVIPYGG